MEGLEATSAVTPAAAPAAPAPAAPAAPAAAPAPAPEPKGGGGGSMDSIKEAFASLNWIEMIMGAAGFGVLLLVGNYYRFQKAAGQALETEIRNEMDDLKIKVADLQSATQRDEILGTPQQAFDGMFY